MHLFCHGTMPPKSPHTSPLHPSSSSPLEISPHDLHLSFCPAIQNSNPAGTKCCADRKINKAERSETWNRQTRSERSSARVCGKLDISLPSSITFARATRVEKHQVSTKRERKEHWMGASLVPLPFDLQKLQLLRSLQFWKWRSRRRICAESEISEL